VVPCAFSVSKTSNGLVISSEVPETVDTKEFTFPVTINNSSNETRFLEVYSYVFKGGDCVSGSWTSNLRILSLGPHEEKDFNMTNTLEQVNGLYSMKLRVKEGEKKTDLQSYINITLKKPWGVTGYTAAAKTMAYAGLSIVGLAALYLVMKRI
jgi:hypothetical protein